MVFSDATLKNIVCKTCCMPWDQYESQQDLSRTDGMGEPTFHPCHTQANMELILQKPRQSEPR